MNIVIIYPNSVYKSGAATNRILSIARGLVECGNVVHMIISRPTENPGDNFGSSVSGEICGVTFEYASQNINWPTNKYTRYLALLKGHIYTLVKLLSLDSNDILISAATTSFTHNMNYAFLAKLMKWRFIHTLDEYPWVVLRRYDYSSVYRFLFLRYYYKLFDGFIVMTRTLIEYYKDLAKRNALFIHIPMSVELDRFSIELHENTFGMYIAYCGGDKLGNKDGIDILIRAFNLVKDEYPEINLLILGDVHPKIPKLIGELSLEQRVALLGFVDREEVPNYLMNAKALCLARPDNKQAEGGFPTKLGEYLASGRPVIVTDVGEISDYLTDGESAYIAKADSIDDFAGKIRLVLSDETNANVIGRSGRVVAECNFDYRKLGERLSYELSRSL